MLSALTIKNIVLIESLNLTLKSGLTALTGETGAGKSILLDALGLILGKRADTGLIRQGQDKGQVIAEFDLPRNHAAFQVLKNFDIEADDQDLVIRRTLDTNGKSKAYVNDTPVSLSLLKDLSASLIEIHGQFDTSGLMDPKTHIDLIDQYGGFSDDINAVKNAYKDLNTAKKDLSEAVQKSEKARTQEDYLRYAVKELEDLSPQIGEEDELSQKRQSLIHREKIADAYNTVTNILDQDNGISDQMQSLQAALDKISNLGSNAIENAVAALSRAQIEIEEAKGQLADLILDEDDTTDPNEIEERLFALKDCARKHNCTIDDLPEKCEQLKSELGLVDDLETNLNALELKVQEAKETFLKRAKQLSEKRRSAADKIEREVMAELPDLKLEKAKFCVKLSHIESEQEWSPKGIDRIEFEIATNPGSAPGPIQKIASGGELSRFMLALKVVLAKISTVQTLIFDEVDSGIGGATADAVGHRLQKLGMDHQILVVTHSPQVAAKGAQQMQVLKTSSDTTTMTDVISLDDQARLEEIARMLSGASVTEEARAAAAKLIQSIAA